MNRFRLLSSLIVIILIFSFFSECSIASSSQSNNKTVYLIVINRYTLQDIDNMPNLRKIIDEGSIGLMNTRGLYNYKGSESFLTINSSKKAYSTYESAETYNLNKENREIYERRISPITGDSQIANVNLNRIIELNKENSYMPHIGALGDSLHNSGLKTAMYGNGDTLEDTIRASSLIAIDSKGLIDYGNVDNILIKDKNFPYGFRTDYDKLLGEVNNIKNKASLVVIDTGDLDRLNFYSEELTDEMFEKHRINILNKIDGFIGNLKNSIDKDKSLFIITSPNSGEDRVDNSKLSPIILWGNNISKSILYSPTTKREGLVTNIDIASSVAKFLGTSTEYMSGNTMIYKENNDNFNLISTNNSRINIISKSRFYILSTYSILSIIVILFAMLVLATNMKLKGILYNILSISLIIIGVIPLSLILTSVIKWTNYTSYIISLITILFLLVLIIYKIKGIDKVLLISSLLYGVLVLDVFLGGKLTRYSVLGHDPAIGARYFGLGNEMIGVFLGATSVFLGIYINKNRNKVFSFVLLIFSAIIVGHPKLGANVGGSIAVLFFVLYFLAETFNKKINFKRILTIGLATVVFILAMAFVDIKFNSNPTHLGRTIMMTNNEGNLMIMSIAIRKLLMNIKLVGSSMWTKVLNVNLISQIVIIFILKDKLRDLFNENKYIYVGFISGIVGSIIGFLANDSGIILASIAVTLINISFISKLVEYIIEEQN